MNEQYSENADQDKASTKQQEGSTQKLVKEKQLSPHRATKVPQTSTRQIVGHQCLKLYNNCDAQRFPGA